MENPLFSSSFTSYVPSRQFAVLENLLGSVYNDLCTASLDTMITVVAEIYRDKIRLQKMECFGHVKLHFSLQRFYSIFFVETDLLYVLQHAKLYQIT